MTTELLLKFSFSASHSLIGNEKPHPHVWRLEVCLTGDPHHGKIIDLIEVRNLISQVFKPLQHAYLNTSEMLDPDTQNAPTCETLSLHFWKTLGTLTHEQLKTQNASIQLQSVSIAIADPGTEELGQITITT